MNRTIEDLLQNGKLSSSQQIVAEHNDGVNENGKPKFEVPIYNVWKFKKKAAGSKHFSHQEGFPASELSSDFPPILFGEHW
ncbi:hypothetical protein MYX84_16310 [Acidobacteria bacterium AH-259-O06]|nr:hypothetical protein [Acidobacteria bacterium AH-259-O06]